MAAMGKPQTRKWTRHPLAIAYLADTIVCLGRATGSLDEPTDKVVGFEPGCAALALPNTRFALPKTSEAASTTGGLFDGNEMNSRRTTVRSPIRALT